MKKNNSNNGNGVNNNSKILVVKPSHGTSQEPQTETTTLEAPTEAKPAEEIEVNDATQGSTEKIEDFKPIGEMVRTTVEALRPVSAEERIKNARDFEHLSERYNFLKAKAEGLKTFEMQSKGTPVSLRLSGVGLDAFDVVNADVVKKLIETAKGELSILLKDTENEIQNFIF